MLEFKYIKLGILNANCFKILIGITILRLMIFSGCIHDTILSRSKGDDHFRSKSILTLHALKLIHD